MIPCYHCRETLKDRMRASVTAGPSEQRRRNRLVELAEKDLSECSEGRCPRRFDEWPSDPNKLGKAIVDLATNHNRQPGPAGPVGTNPGCSAGPGA